MSDQQEDLVQTVISALSELISFSIKRNYEECSNDSALSDRYQDRVKFLKEIRDTFENKMCRVLE